MARIFMYRASSGIERIRTNPVYMRVTAPITLVRADRVFFILFAPLKSGDGRFLSWIPALRPYLHAMNAVVHGLSAEVSVSVPNPLDILPHRDGDHDVVVSPAIHRPLAGQANSGAPADSGVQLT